MFHSYRKLGVMYDAIDSTNLWQNEYLRNNEIDGSSLRGQTSLVNVNQLYTGEI